MKKIVILNGAGKKDGNTRAIIDAFRDGAAGNEMTEFYLQTMSIHGCLDCGTCGKKEKGSAEPCVQQDDMADLYGRLMAADALVIASPVYFYGISAQLKTLVDRLHTPMRNRFKIRKLGLILVGAAALPDLFDPILLQYRMILRFFHLEDIGTVLVRGTKDKGDVLQGDGLKQAYALGNKLAQE